MQSGPFKGQDSKLVREAVKGNPDAWHDIIEKYSPYVYTILRSARVPESEEADAFQYVFVELFKSLENLTRTDSLAPWLRQTALRHAVRLRDKQAKRGPSLSEVEAVADPDGLEAEVIQADQAQHVREAVDSLQDRCRELIVRLFFDDPPQPYAEVAEALGIKVASLGMTRQRCLEALERALRARGIQ